MAHREWSQRIPAIAARFVPTVLAVGIGASSPAQLDVSQHFAPYEGDAIGLMPPELVSGPRVVRSIWSQDGKWLLVWRVVDHITENYLKALAKDPSAQAESRGEFYAWNVERHSGRVVYTFDPSTTEVRIFYWLAGRPLAVASLLTGKKGRRVQSILLLRTDDGPAQSLYQTNESDEAMLNVSPMAPFATLTRVWEGSSGREVEMRILDENGHLSEPTHLNVSTPAGMIMAGYDPSGDGPFAYLTVDGPNGFGSSLRRFRFRAGGEMKPVSDAMIPENMPNSGAQLNFLPGLKFSRDPMRTASRPVGKDALWLTINSQKPKTILVAADGTEASAAPYGTGVAYCHEGHLFFRRFLRIPLSVYIAQAVASDRKAAETTCHHAASRLQMFTDQSNHFPDLATWAQMTQTAYAGKDTPPFTYTYGGGVLPASNIRIGQCVTEFGTMYLKADWSTEWVPRSG